MKGTVALKIATDETSAPMLPVLDISIGRFDRKKHTKHSPETPKRL
jgi:hypothetical protein